MKLLYFKREGRLCPGILTDRGIVDVEAVLGRGFCLDDMALLKEMEAEGVVLPEERGLVVGPCVGTPSKIICIGLNYRQHALESGMPVPAIPVVFTKYNNTLVDYGGVVPLGKVGSQFDYEVELRSEERRVGKEC